MFFFLNVSTNDIRNFKPLTNAFIEYINVFAEIENDI